MNYARPDNLAEALTLLSQDEWAILSGGTDFYPASGDGCGAASRVGNVLDIWALGELKSIQNDESGVRIGAGVCWSDVIAADLPPAFDGLKLAAREIGSVQIQNHATVIGNICNASPAADGVPPLLSLSAQVELVSVSGKRLLPLQEFIRGNRETDRRADELVSAIVIPASAVQGNSVFLKLGSRKYLVISIVMVAVRLHCDSQHRIADAAVSVGSCSVVAQRLSSLEHALLGQRLSADLAARVLPGYLASLAPIDDVRASKGYRMEAAQQLLQRALVSLQGELS